MGDGGGGFFRGTSIDQDGRYGDKQKKLLAGIKFPPEFEQKVDMKKVALELIKPWIAQKVTDLLGAEDDIVVTFAYAMLENTQFPEPKMMQVNLTGFLEAQAPEFMKELWKLLLSAQNSIGGAPEEFLRKKREELLKKREEEQKNVTAIQRTLAPAAAGYGLVGTAKPTEDVRKEASSAPTNPKERDSRDDRDRDPHRRSDRDSGRSDRRDNHRDRDNDKDKDKDKERDRDRDSRDSHYSSGRSIHSSSSHHRDEDRRDRRDRDSHRDRDHKRHDDDRDRRDRDSRRDDRDDDKRERRRDRETRDEKEKSEPKEVKAEAPAEAVTLTVANTAVSVNAPEEAKKNAPEEAKKDE